MYIFEYIKFDSLLHNKLSSDSLKIIIIPSTHFFTTHQMSSKEGVHLAFLKIKNKQLVRDWAGLCKVNLDCGGLMD